MAGRRDEELFSGFVQARSRALLQTAYLLTGEQGLAEDLLQTALVKVYVALPRLRAPDALEAYARRTLATTAASWWRRRWRGERPTEYVPEGPPAPDRASELAERAQIWAWVGELPPRQRAVIVLRYYEDLSEIQTAELLGCSVGTVKTQAHRALRRLRQSVEGEAVGIWEEKR